MRTRAEVRQRLWIYEFTPQRPRTEAHPPQQPVPLDELVMQRGPEVQDDEAHQQRRQPEVRHPGRPGREAFRQRRTGTREHDLRQAGGKGWLTSAQDYRAAPSRHNPSAEEVCFRVQSGRFSGSVVSLKLTQSIRNRALI